MRHWFSAAAGVVVAITVCLIGASASAQQPAQPQQQQPPQQPGQQPSQGVQTQPGAPIDERLPLPAPIPVATPYPLELFGLLGPPARGITLVPSIAFSEEYNDNLFLSQTGKESDFITTLTPALSLYANRPRYRLIAGVAVSAELYAKHSELDNGLGRTSFLLSGDFNATPQLILRLSDTLALDRNTSATNIFTTGRQLSLTNSLTPGLRWQITPQSWLDASANYTTRRFFESGVGANSNDYSAQINYLYAFTRRFTGLVGYGFSYLDLTNQENSTTHTPIVGFTYLLLPGLTIGIQGGPAITEIGGDTFISPAGTAGFVWNFRSGTLSASYNESVAVAGGFGGTTDEKIAVATLLMPTWIRNLNFLISPSYTKSKSVDSSQPTQVDVEAFRVSLGIVYQISRYVSAFGGYEFVHQTTGSDSTTQANANQNRVRVGLQVGYPFSLD